MEDLSQDDPVYWRVARKKDSIEAQCSRDGSRFTTIRQGYFPPFVEVRVGVMCAAPEGAGFEAVFDELRLDKI
jgi:regulation of enolase protein 1 (concanavalin A-like superfamily)